MRMRVILTLILLTIIITMLMNTYYFTPTNEGSDHNGEDEEEEESYLPEGYYLDHKEDSANNTMLISIESQPTEPAPLNEIKLYLSVVRNTNTAERFSVLTGKNSPYTLEDFLGGLIIPFDYARTYNNETPMEPVRHLELHTSFTDVDNDLHLSTGDIIRIYVSENGDTVSIPYYEFCLHSTVIARCGMIDFYYSEYGVASGGKTSSELI